MKITYSTEQINSFGGINFADHIVSKASVYKTIDETLGQRGVKAEYLYSDLFRSYLLMVLCGGECAEDITEHLRTELAHGKGVEVCSADTLLRMQKELATKKETTISKTGVEHDFNINISMNKLLVKLLVLTGQLSTKNDNYIFDYDNQFIPANKYDSKRSYKHADGYFPGIASIGNFPVYIENRNGNSNVKYKQDQTLKRAYGVLGENGIKVKHSRMDCGSFDQRVVPVVEANSKYFYIRAQRCVSLYDNDRGDGERLFDEMNNDFLWKKMPFSFLHENTVFLVMMAICRNLYHFLTDFISKKLNFIKPTFRLKKFIFRFMVVPSKWINRGRQQILKLFSTKKYHLLMQ